jgi:predicted N-acetyltransferase YhbS
VRIDFLSAHSQFIDTISQWHHEEWGDFMPYWSEADARTELHSHTGRVMIPTTLVALEGSELLGSVSLVVHDLEEWKGKYSPWLASLYVRPDSRSRGIGTELVKRAMEVAREAGVKTLHVVAAHSEEYYLRLGWRTIERTVLRGIDTAILVLEFQ